MAKVFVLLIVLSGFGIRQSSPSGSLSGSAHDFTNAEWNPTGDPCLPCHAPGTYSNSRHGDSRMTAGADARWSSMGQEAQYRTYVNIRGMSAGQPTGVSKMCLGCHDGSVALDDFAGGVHNGARVLWDFRIGSVSGAFGDLRRTHPISVPYEYDPADIDGLRDPAEPVGISGSISSVLDDGRVSCVSCHDVHNQVVMAPPLLRAPMRGSSALCLSCHKK